MRSFTVAISDSAFDRLKELALQERRQPRHQAGYMLEKLLMEIVVAEDIATTEEVLC